MCYMHFAVCVSVILLVWLAFSASACRNARLVLTTAGCSLNKDRITARMRLETLTRYPLPSPEQHTNTSSYKERHHFLLRVSRDATKQVVVAGTGMSS